MAAQDVQTRKRTLSLNHVTVYIDREKRQSHSQSNSGYRAVERLLKNINRNPERYQHQKCVLIDIVWRTHVWYIVLSMFVIAIVMTLFFVFFPESIAKIWGRKIWLYLCVGISAFIALSVSVYYVLQFCDKKRWTTNELERIHDIIKETNLREYADKRKKTYNTKKDWTYYTDSDDDPDPQNINNLHYVTLIAQPLDKGEIEEDVIKMKIQIWLENKPKHMDQVQEESDGDGDENERVIAFILTILKLSIFSLNFD